MIFKAINDQRPIEDGQIVAFVTGLKSVNTYPNYLRVGEVVDAKDFAIKELSTGKIWKVYSSNIIVVGDEGKLQGVETTFRFVDKV